MPLILRPFQQYFSQDFYSSLPAAFHAGDKDYGNHGPYSQKIQSDHWKFQIFNRFIDVDWSLTFEDHFQHLINSRLEIKI